MHPYNIQNRNPVYYFSKRFILQPTWQLKSLVAKTVNKTPWSLGVIQKLRGQDRAGRWSKKSLFLSKLRVKKDTSREVLKKGQNYVHVVIEWPLCCMLFKNQNFMVDAWYVLLTETVFSGPLSFLISLVDKVVCKHPHVFAKNCKKLQFMRGIWTIQWLSFRRDILHTIGST